MTVTSVRGSVGRAIVEGRRRSGLALLAGALVMEFVIQQQVLRFYWTPLIVGLTYLAAAMVAGRRAALWAPGIVTTCWGISVLLGVHGAITIDSALSYEIAGAIGIVIALALRAAIGLAAGPIGLVVSFGVILLHTYAHAPSWIFHGVTFAILLGVWGLWELLRPSSVAAAGSPADAEESEEPTGLPRPSVRV